MINFYSSVTIGRHVGEVFAFVADRTNIPKWQSDIVQSQPVSEGPIGLGTRFDEVVRIMGRNIKTTCEITEYEQDQLMAFNSNSAAGINYSGRFTLEPVEAGTRVNLSGTVTLSGLWRLAEPFFALEVKSAVEQELRNLKSLLEAEASRRVA
jgi:uncharacterized membrane protein